MSPENRIAFFVSAGVALLIGVAVSDHLARRAPSAGDDAAERAAREAPSPSPIHATDPIPTPEALGPPPREAAARDRGDVARRGPDGRSRAGQNGDPSDTAGSEQPAPRADRAAETAEKGRTHRVTSGESLWQIAKEYYGRGREWRRIKRANPTRVRASGRVRAGVQLLIPPLDAPGDRKKRGAPETRERMASAGASSAGASDGVRVEAGDTLAGLAREHLGSATRWRALARANDLAKPDELEPGMTLELPEEEGAADGRGSSAFETYVVEEGDTLYSIARRVLGDAKRWRRILEANAARVSHPGDLEVGQRLDVPRS